MDEKKARTEEGRLMLTQHGPVCDICGEYILLDPIMESFSVNGINFVVLSSGVCVCFTEENKLELFHKNKGSSGGELIEDKALQGNVLLFTNGSQLFMGIGKKLFSVVVRKK